MANLLALRKRDTFVENELSKFLDKYLYSKSEIFSNFQRCSDQDSQFNGIDTIISIPKLGLTDIKVDEKAQLNEKYIGNPLPTFVLELTFINAVQNIQEGWFIRDDLDTEYYLLIWIDEATGDHLYLTETNIQRLNFCLVNTNKLHLYFDSIGYTRDKLLEKYKEMVSQDKLIKEIIHIFIFIILTI